MGITGIKTSYGKPYPCGSSKSAVTLVTCLLLVVGFPLAAQALDGRVDVRGNQQDGGAGATAYETNTLWENYSLSQRYDIVKGLIFQIDFVTRRQTLDSQSLLGSSNTEIISYLPNASLSYRSNDFRAGLNARASRKDHSGSSLQSWRDENADFNIWARNKWEFLDLEANAHESTGQRASGPDIIDTREHSQSGSAKLHLSQQDELRYSFSRNVQDLRSFNTNITYLSHALRYRGSHGFAGGRGRVSIDARGNLLKQTSGVTSENGLTYLPPIWGGYSLDDTPEEWDSLESDPIFLGTLFNQDRDTPTTINIGDSAPVVRQYGGDYRNLIFNFGDTEKMDEIILYVDTVLRFPELMQWRVFVSDDPEGRDWSEELDASQFTATWQEMTTGRQGWSFSFPATIEHQRIKLVNYKLGLTEPDILVTEMEIYHAPDSSDQDSSQTVRRHRLQGDLSYNLSSKINLMYSTNLSGRHYNETGRDVTGSSHRFGANWATGIWRLAASHEMDRIKNTTGQNTDANSQRVTMSGRFSRTFQARVAWVQTEDQSWTLRHKTQTTSGDLNWQIAPRLTINQKVSFGTRDASSLAVDSRAWTLATTIRGRPRPSWEIELRRNDRWVSQEAGADFSTFNNTELQSTWAVAPLLTLTSQVVYQVREEDDVLVRNSLLWNPIPGGSVSLRLHATDFQDTRTDWTQRGGGSTVVWRPRPRLLLEGGIEWSLVKQGSERNTPTSIHFRGNWSF